MTEDPATNPSRDIQDRRKGRRFAVGWPTRLAGIDESGTRFDQEVALTNLSSGGAYFVFARQVPVGARLEVSIKVPFKRESWMQYSGLVVRVDQSSSDTGVALRFDGFRPSFAQE